jgi:hypothetical protein
METVHLLTCRISQRQRRLRPLRAQTPARTQPLMAPSLGARRGEAAGSWVTVRVRADDITGALQDARLARHPAHYCPVARALCRVLAVPLGWVTIGPSNVDCEAWHARPGDALMRHGKPPGRCRVPGAWRETTAPATGANVPRECRRSCREWRSAPGSSTHET